MPEVQLVIVEGPNAGKEFVVSGALVLGRDPSAGIVLEDAEASRRHASVSATGAAAEVEDLGSTNGTFVNGERISGTRPLKDGDKVRIGTTVLELRGLTQPTMIASTIPDQDAGRTMVASTIPDAPAGAPAGGDAPEADLDDLPTVAPPPSEPAPAPAAAAPEPAAPAAPPPAAEPPAFGPPPSDAPAFGPPPTGAPGFPPAPAEAPAPQFGPPPGPAGFPAPPPAPGQAVAPAAGGYAPAGPGFQVRPPVAQWLLCIFVPFYGIVWYHRLQKEIGEWSGGRIHTSPGTSVLAVTLGGLIVVPAIVSIVGTMGRVRQCQQMAGLQPTVSFWGFVGRNLLFGYGYKWLTEQINEIATRRPIQ